jgi:hypothetical protein
MPDRHISVGERAARRPSPTRKKPLGQRPLGARLFDLEIESRGRHLDGRHVEPGDVCGVGVAHAAFRIFGSQRGKWGILCVMPRYLLLGASGIRHGGPLPRATSVTDAVTFHSAGASPTEEQNAALLNPPLLARTAIRLSLSTQAVGLGTSYGPAAGS